MTHTILIADDHPIVREGLKTFLNLQSDLQVIAETDSLQSTLALSQTHQPDLVLLDVQLTDGNALTILPALKAVSDKLKVLILTSFTDEQYIRDALKRGASGYVLKHSGPATLVDHIRAVLRGEIPLDSSVVQVLAEPQHDPLAELTARELQVLTLMTQGMTNKQIATNMRITEKTVKTHASSVFSKLGVRDRTQAALLAKDLGL